MKHSSKNGCSERDEVFNPYTNQWECMHCGNTLSFESQPMEKKP